MKSFLSILILTSLCTYAKDGAAIKSQEIRVRMIKGKSANANCKVINGKWVCDETADAKKLVRNIRITMPQDASTNKKLNLKF